MSHFIIEKRDLNNHNRLKRTHHNSVNKKNAKLVLQNKEGNKGLYSSYGKRTRGNLSRLKKRNSVQNNDTTKPNNDSCANLSNINDQEESKENHTISKNLKKIIQVNLMKAIINPEAEYQKELEKKRKLRVKARNKYNQGMSPFPYSHPYAWYSVCQF